MVFGLFRKKQVIVYSMDSDADAPARMALGRTSGLRVTHLFTLDRAKVAKIMLTAANPPKHIQKSDRILRRELAGKTPYYFITIVADPEGKTGAAKKWFDLEYKPATGIDASDFDHAEVSREYKLGPHRILLLSAFATRAEQERIISLFLICPLDKIADKQLTHISAYWHKMGAINKPLAVLNDIPTLEDKIRPLHASLEAQARLLNGPYRFSDMPDLPPYAPRANGIMYNAHQSLPFHTSGYATRTQGLYKAVRSKGWDLNVVTRAGYPFDTRIDPAGLADNNIDGIPYFYDTRDEQGQWSFPMDEYFDRSAAYLVEQAHRLKPAVLHTASNFINAIPGIEAARRLGIPSVFEMRGLWHVTKWSKDPTYNKTERFALAQKMELEAANAATRVIAITGALKEWLIERGVDGDKIFVAPNAVDLSQFVPVPRDKAFERELGCEGKIVIGYIGSFVQYEGLDLLLQGVAQLTDEQRGRIRLLWMGDGAMLEEWLTLASELGIRDLIVSLGRRPFEDVPRAYSLVDICVFPRKGQPICEIVGPLKPFEAMAMKKAVIVSDVRPLQEIVEPGVTGLIHKKDDAASLSRELARFIDDEPLRRACGEHARTWIEKTRQWDIIADTVSGVYKTVA